MENVSDVLSLSKKGNAMMWSTPGRRLIVERATIARALMQQCHPDPQEYIGTKFVLNMVRLKAFPIFLPFYSSHKTGNNGDPNTCCTSRATLSKSSSVELGDERIGGTLARWHVGTMARLAIATSAKPQTLTLISHHDC